jgi:hypothetical protein
MTPNIQVDWTASGEDRFSIPVGLGTIGFFRVGKIPVRWGVVLQHYIHQPDLVGPEWNLKLFVSLVKDYPFELAYIDNHVCMLITIPKLVNK